MALTITIDSVDVTDSVKIDSINISEVAESGQVATCDLTIIDDGNSLTIEATDDVDIDLDGTTMFAGEVAGAPNEKELAPDKVEKNIHCQGYGKLLHETVVTETEYALSGPFQHAYNEGSDPGDDYFVVLNANITSWFTAGDQFDIYNSPGGTFDGTYTVNSTSFITGTYNTKTRVYVDENLTSGDTWMSGTTFVKRRSDSQIISDLFSDHEDSWSIDASTNVDTEKTYMQTRIVTGNCTLAEALESIAEATGVNPRWWIDYSKNLHWTSSPSTNSDGLSDSYDGSSTFRYWDLDVQAEQTLINKVYIVGRNTEGNIISKWVTDASSISSYGEREHVVVDYDINTEEGLEDLGQGIIDANKDPSVSAVLWTYHDGFNAGEFVEVTSSVYGWSAESLFIRRIDKQFFLDSDGNADVKYQLHLGDSPWGISETQAAMEQRIRKLERREVADAPEAGGTSGGAPTDAQYLTLALTSALTAERQLIPGDGLDGTDSATEATYTLDIDVSDFIGDGLRDSGSETIAVDVSDFAGAGLEDDGSENLRIAAAAAGDGLQGGAGSALAVDVSDFAGDGLEDDGSENLRVDVTDFIDTAAGLTETSNDIQVNLQASGGLDFYTGAIGIDVSDFAIAGNLMGDDGSENIYAYGLRQSDNGADALVSDANGDMTAYGGITFDAAETIATSAGDLTFSPTGDLNSDSDLEFTGNNAVYESYTSGAFGAGYKLTYDGTESFLELDNLTIRGTLRTHIFQKDIIRATNGYLFISDSSLVTNDPDTGNNYIFCKENVFQANDLIWYKDFELGESSLSIYSVKMTVDSADGVTADGDYQFTVTVDNGTLSNVKAGGTVARVGNTSDSGRQGAIFNDASSTYSPFIDIYDGVSSWDDSSASDVPTAIGSSTSLVRIGNLEGVTGTTEHGLYAGTNTSDSYLVASDQAFELHGIKQYLYDSGNTQRGLIDPSAGDADELLWLGPSSSDPRFVVYGDGDAWLSNLAISSTLQEQLFTQTDGLLLLGPSCPMTSTSWESLRGQEATISGAFHPVAGAWAGTQALLVEPAATNYVENPIAYANVTDFWTHTQVGSGGSASRDTSKSLFGPACFKVTEDDTTYSQLRSDSFTVADGDSVTLSGYIHRYGNVDAAILLYDATNAATRITLTATKVDEWEYLFDTWTNDTGGDVTVRVNLRNNNAGGGTAFIRFDGIQAEMTDYPTSLVHGGLGTGYSWSGDAHNSTSSRTATEINLDDSVELVSSNTGFSVRTVVQARFDADGTWPNNYGRVWELGGTGSRYLRLIYNAVSDVWQLTASDGTDSFTLNGSTTQTFNRGDWIELIVTADYASDEYKLYVDGELDGTDTTSLSTTAFTAWNIGTDVSGSTHASVAVSEYGTMDSVLTAEQVAGLYQRGAPLVDAGAYDSPGVYILDGQFRIASSTSANRIEIVPDEIAGYDSAGAKQFYLQSSDGKAYAGNGAVELQHNGIFLNEKLEDGYNKAALHFMNGDGTLRLADIRASQDNIVNGESVLFIAAEEDSADSPSAYSEIRLVTYYDTTGSQTQGASVYIGGKNDDKTGIRVTGHLAVSNGLAIGDNSLAPDTGAFVFAERSSDPSEPSEGEAVIWMSDGTGKGDDGDIMIASQAGGTTNYGTLFDHSGGSAW